MHEVADWFPHKTISSKRRQIASLLSRLSGARRGSTRLPVLPRDIPVHQRLRELQDNIQAMTRIRANIDSKMQEAMDWLGDPVKGGTGEECLKAIIKMTLRVAERSLPIDAEKLKQLADDISQKLRNEIDTNRTSEVLGEIKVKLSKVLASVLQATRDLERDFSKKEKHFNTIKCNKKRKNEEKMDLRKKSRRDK